MNFITILIDSIATFIRRNPLLCLFIVMLAFLAPSVLTGLAAFLLYFLLGILLMGAIILLSMRWRLRRMQREMHEQFGGSRQDPFGGFNQSGARTKRPQEGDVKVHVTSETPEKRISEDVGDYVDFEETKDKN